MKPICVKCRRFYRIKRNGQWFTEMMPGAGHKRPEAGNADPNAWVPYKIWVGDLWHCPDCGSEIVVGVGSGPVSEHYKPDFEDARTIHGADELNINDC